MNKKLLWVMLSLGIYACQDKEDLVTISEPNQTKSKMTVLGKKLQNPFSVSNMQKAYQNIKTGKAGARVAAEDVEIKATHLYLKFKPHNDEELMKLKQDTTLKFFTRPIDYEIAVAGDYYHDPSLPDSVPTFQYVSYPVDKALPEGIAYDVLSDLYLPEDPVVLQEGNLRLGTAGFRNALQEEALRITGNAETPSPNQPNKRVARYRPRGSMTIQDNDLGIIRPLVGVKVCASWWWYNAIGITDGNGNYSCNDTFYDRNRVTYSLDWERHEFQIRSGWYYTAECNDPQTNASWSRNFEAGDAQYLYATTFMAAMDYYYGDIQGLLRPKKNCFICSKMKLSVYDEPCESFSGEFLDIRGRFGLLSQIKIYNNVNYHIPQIYTTVIHELTHSAHYEMSPYHFIFADGIVLESWSCGVGWFMASRKWPNFIHLYGRAKGNTIRNYDYTGIVQDLIDGIDANNGDMVSGYTIAQIQAALFTKCTMNDWKENLKTRYNNATEENLDALFDYWN